MFLIVILLATLILFFSPLVVGGVSSILMLTNKKSSIAFLFLVCVVIAIPALFFIPNISYDATRIFNEMHRYISYPNFISLAKSYIESNSDYKSYPIFTFFMYISAKWGYFGLLPFIVLIFTYFFMLAPIMMEFKNSESNRVYTIFMLVSTVSWISYVSTISGMRFYVATAIMFLTIYFDIFKKSELNRVRLALIILGYLVGMLIHPGMILFVLIRLLAMMVNKVNPIVVLVGLFFVSSALQLVANFKTNLSNGYVSILLNRYITYSQNSNFADLRTTSLVLKEIVVIAVCIFLLVSALHELLRKNNRYNNLMNFFVLCLSFLMISFALSPNLLDRYGLVVIPILAIYFPKIKKNSFSFLIFDILILGIIISGLNYNQNLSFLIFSEDIKSIMINPLVSNFSNIIQYI